MHACGLKQGMNHKTTQRTQYKTMKNDGIKKKEMYQGDEKLKDKIKKNASPSQDEKI